jgi:hypothetical protein
VSDNKYIVRSLMICTAHEILLGDQLEKNEIGGACSTFGVEKRCIQGFGMETLERRSFGRPRRRWEDNIKMDLRDVGWGAWTGSIWLRTETGGGHL